MADIEALNESIMNIIGDFYDEYSAVESVDHATRCANLEPGSPAPKKGGIKLTDNLQHINAYGYQAEEKIRSLCESERSSVLASMSEAPSDDAVRMMQAISMRDSVSQADLDAFNNRYGSNYQARKFVADQVKKRKIGTTTEDPCDEALRLIEHAQSVGESSVKPHTLNDKDSIGQAARRAMVKDQLYGTGLFSML